MNTFFMILVCVLPIVGLAVAYMIGKRTLTVTKSARKAFSRHFTAVAMALVLCLAFTTLVSAETPAATAETTETAAVATAEEATEASSGAGLAVGLGFLAAALAIGLAAVGAGMALAAGAPAAIGAVAEDSKSFGKSMIFVVLGEALAIYGFIVAFFIIMKLPTIPAV